MFQLLYIKKYYIVKLSVPWCENLESVMYWNKFTFAMFVERE